MARTESEADPDTSAGALRRWYGNRLQNYRFRTAAATRLIHAGIHCNINLAPSEFDDLSFKFSW